MRRSLVVIRIEQDTRECCVRKLDMEGKGQAFGEACRMVLQAVRGASQTTEPSITGLLPCVNELEERRKEWNLVNNGKDYSDLIELAGQYLASLKPTPLFNQ